MRLASEHYIYLSKFQFFSHNQDLIHCQAKLYLQRTFFKKRSMADNQQHWANMTGGETSKAKEATVIPANRKHVSTMMAERAAKFVASTAKNIKNKKKINPADEN